MDWTHFLNQLLVLVERQGLRAIGESLFGLVVNFHDQSIGAYGDARVSYIDCYDIAACAAVLLTDPGTTGRSYVLTGPEALNHTEIAAKLTAACGRPVKYLDLPPEQFAARLTAQGLPAGFAADVAALYANVATGVLGETTTAVEDLTGHKPRTFDEFLANTLSNSALQVGPQARKP